jgi:hypothetical protein
MPKRKSVPPEHFPLCIGFRPLVAILATALDNAFVQFIDDAVSETGVGYPGRCGNRKWSSPSDLLYVVCTITTRINGNETRRVFEPHRIVAHIRVEIASASELDRIFADEPADLRRIVTRPIIRKAGLGV